MGILKSCSMEATITETCEPAAPTTAATGCRWCLLVGLLRSAQVVENSLVEDIALLMKARLCSNACVSTELQS